MSNNCALYVAKGLKYCCAPKVFEVGDSAVTVNLANIGPVNLLSFPTGNTTDPSFVHSVLEDGATTIFDAGTYMLDLDCEALDGADVPEDPALWAMACCSELSTDATQAAIFCAKLEAIFGEGGSGDTSQNTEILLAVQACLAQMKLLIAANNDSTILAEISNQLLLSCDKMIANGESLEAICKKLEIGFADMVNCLNTIKEHTACLPEIKALLECPPGYGDQCFFNTYATADYNVDAVLVGEDDISAKVGAPFDGNNAPAHVIFRDALIKCLENDYGYDVAFTQGRDGFQIKYFGSPVNLTTS